MKNFEDWTYEDLELTFGISRVKNFQPLKDWLVAKAQINELEKAVLENLRATLDDHADAWNEDELKFQFIGPLTALVNFNGERHSVFTQRPMSARLKDIRGNETDLKGRVEFVVALGKQTPRIPYFFLHEYKQEKRRDNDPLGQLLATMVVAQELNKLDFPLFGCYVIGRLWFFVVLQGKKYGLSRAFDASQKDLLEIFSMLKFAKNEIDQRVQALPPGV